MYPYDIQEYTCECDTVCTCRIQFWEGVDPPYPEPLRINVVLEGNTVTIDGIEYTILMNRDILLRNNYAGRIIGYYPPFTLIRWNGQRRHEAYIL